MAKGHEVVPRQSGRAGGQARLGYSAVRASGARRRSAKVGELMVRAILEIILVMVVARSLWRVIGGIMEGLGARPRTGVPRSGPPDRGVSMTRDPVCGTFVVPERALALHDGR